MCGIAGIIMAPSATTVVAPHLMASLRRLQNRGYDSAGICVAQEGALQTRKFASTETQSALAKLEAHLAELTSHLGIAHTRWATHGGKTDANSHPHLSNGGEFAVVHNGIIENFEELRAELVGLGYRFDSETDTEVIANLLAHYFHRAPSPTQRRVDEVLARATERLRGTWAIVVVAAHVPNTMFCTRNGSPLLVGEGEGLVAVVSEQSAFPHSVRDYLVLDNRDICSVTAFMEEHPEPAENAAGSAAAGLRVCTQRTYARKPRSQGDALASPHPFPTWTLREIYDQQHTVRSAISFGGRLDIHHVHDSAKVMLGGLSSHREELLALDNLLLLGCGTSFHAGMLGATLLRRLANFNCVQVIDGADFTALDIPRDGKTGVFLLSQSGETKDLHRCIRVAKTHRLLSVGIINVVDSMIAREVDCGVYLNAGPEVGVASTKSFTSQCIVLALVACWFSQHQQVDEGKRRARNECMADLRQLVSTDMSALLADGALEDAVSVVLPTLLAQEHCFVLGKGVCEAVAREGSLKIKEISYLHSEAYSTSSLKHGPFALLRDHFPVILLDMEESQRAITRNACHEILSRGATVLCISDTLFHTVPGSRVHSLLVPHNEWFGPVLASVALQMIAYKLSVARDLNPDLPRNLAKVVTVE